MAFTEKTQVSLGLKTITALLMAVFGLGGSAAVAHYQIHDTTERVQRLEDGERDHDRRIQRTEDLGVEVRDELKELRRDVKELLRRGTP